MEGLVWAAELAILAPIVANVGCFPLYGLAAFVICLSVTFIAIVLSRAFIGKLHINVERTPIPSSGQKNTTGSTAKSWSTFKEAYKDFLKIELCLFICLVFLVGYIFAFRYVSAGVQV